MGWVNLFTSKWPGTMKGCSVNGDIISLQEFTSKYNEGSKNHTCTVVPPVSEVEMRNPFGTYLCGKEGGDRFVDVVRVDGETGVCPEGTEPCSNSTSPSNTVCYPPTSLNSSCPITSIQFIQSPAVPPANYTNVGIYAGTSTLVYSRDYDSTPVTTFRVDYRPCVNPEEYENPPTSQFYPLEYALDSKNCTPSQWTNKTYDQRYIDLEMPVTQYDVQSPGQVIKILKE